MSELGRIGGQALTDNLLRSGVDLAFETDLLYFDVVDRKISINQTPPIYDLDVNSDVRTNDLTIVDTANLDNIKLVAPNSITTTVGGIDIYPFGLGEIFHDKLITANLMLDGNLISSFSDSNIVLDPNGSGTVELLADTNITGDLAVSGNINLDGDLTGLGQLVLGDRIIDTVTVNTDFTQSIIPGDDITYTLGWDAGDSSPRRWAQLHSPEWRYITNGTWEGSGIHPLSVDISYQTTLDGVNNKISAVQSNEDILLSPDTGIIYIERTKWENNEITNLNDTPLTIASTGTGYYKFNGSDAIVIPFGTDADRRLSPELGETRWNSDLGYLECFDGSIWVISTGGGEEVTTEIMEDLGNVYTLILG